MKTILFPTDFSDNAKHAAQYAGMLARLFNARVVLLNIYSIPTISEYQLPSDIENFINRNRKEAEQNLEKFTVDFIKKSGLVPERITQKVEYGLATDKIVSIAKQIHADLIVMGTKGASNIFERWLGTHSQEVMKTASCPVWVIPANAPINYPQHLLYAADFQGDEVAAIQKILTTTQPLGSKCKVVHIHDYFEPNGGYAIQEMKGFLEDKFQGNNLEVKCINRAEIIEGLETYIKNHKPDVIVLAIHEKSLLDRFFNESVTKHFIQEGNLPLLFFKK
ncbi:MULTISPECIES: universal stress protein [unclassified Arcicella]|uniref:universal stress protein n=1 Tax=unclassified Arcicella TaxID=2644986 RepID=UPI0028653EBD|nr:MULTISPECIES: universal stress protein [unclassified Arcicella]MDR6560265.1 nucleotide-binding universal stress UspA family protein [Arcicella sp. BE51]MDR6810129.1 nucleotide-binding universal stress UspA family protein [Arcicella sp. BE140]MDR6821478.1 nucleotide-binding universal stress UspA family protein [Arcicella sp. BE139]